MGLGGFQMDSEGPRLSDALLNAQEVSKLLKVSLPTVYAWRERGLLAGFRLGSSIRFSKTDVQDFLRRGRLEARARIQTVDR